MSIIGAFGVARWSPICGTDCLELWNLVDGFHIREPVNIAHVDKPNFTHGMLQARSGKGAMIM